MKNRLTNLNDALFEQLERLNDNDLKDEALKAEIHRSKAMSDIGGRIIENAKVALEGQKLRYDHRNLELPEMLENKGPLEREVDNESK